MSFSFKKKNLQFLIIRPAAIAIMFKYFWVSSEHRVLFYSNIDWIKQSSNIKEKGIAERRNHNMKLGTEYTPYRRFPLWLYCSFSHHSQPNEKRKTNAYKFGWINLTYLTLLIGARSKQKFWTRLQETLLMPFPWHLNGVIRSTKSYQLIK